MTVIDYGKTGCGESVLLLGYFDSLHIGHRELIGCAKEFGCKVALLTFSDKYVLKGDLVYTFDERLKILQGLGIDTVIKADFDEEFKNTAAADFLHRLKHSLNICAIVCGYDYKFGAGAVAGTEYLSEYCSKSGIALRVCGQVNFQGEKASSSLAKKLLKAGDISSANSLLGGDFFLSGQVIGGRKVGRTLGFPTANIDISPLKTAMKEGVYSVYAYIDGRRYGGVCHIGKRPTFGDFSPSVEVFFDGFDGDLYGRDLTVCFTKFLRETVKFSSADGLKAQIKKDLENIYID